MDENERSKRTAPFERTLYGYVGFLIALGLVEFLLTYGFNGRESARPFEFYRTFFIFLAFYCLCIFLLSQARNLLAILLLIFLSLTALWVIGYSLNDFLTIRLSLFLAFQTVLLACCTFPLSLILCPVVSIAGITLLQIPQLLGENELNLALRSIQVPELWAFFSISLCTALLQVGLAQYRQLYLKAQDQIVILNSTITKLTVFSQSLQSYARTAEIEATKKERYRISREIHDISGYMFTNIIAMMDAIVSTGCRNSEKTSEMCSAARSQAQEGLTETRKALHLLRANEQERETGIKAIYKIKKIFEGTTGVSVDIEAGNLPASFGDEIDLVLYRVVQEGLTNALRHGHANHVRMLFWIITDQVQIIILDNGSGAKKITKGIGLAGMEERISKLGGTVHAGNAPEGGFQLTVTIPLQKEHDHDSNSVG